MRISNDNYNVINIYLQGFFLKKHTKLFQLFSMWAKSSSLMSSLVIKET